jgi:SAM-dependent methyltransferase
MSNYSELAQFYDAVVGDKSSRIAFLQKLIQEHAPHASTLLEMACGTGTLIEGLSKKYKVAGLDLSPEMVELAKKKVPAADIRVADMADYNFGQTFDVVLCIYDAVNHLQNWEQWQATFTNAQKHLKKHGLFIFDLNRPERHECMLASIPHSHPIGDDHMYMAASRENGKFKWTVRIFQKDSDGRYTLHEDEVYETAFPFDQVKREVSKLFDIREVVDANGLQPEDPNWRPFLVCIKK